MKCHIKFFLKILSLSHLQNSQKWFSKCFLFTTSANFLTAVAPGRSDIFQKMIFNATKSVFWVVRANLFLSYGTNLSGGDAKYNIPFISYYLIWNWKNGLNQIPADFEWKSVMVRFFYPTKILWTTSRISPATVFWFIYQMIALSFGHNFLFVFFSIKKQLVSRQVGRIELQFGIYSKKGCDSHPGRGAQKKFSQGKKKHTNIDTWIRF